MPLELPDIRQEKVVVFHLQEDSPTDVVLQIPPKEKTQRSNTYAIDLLEPKDSAWVTALRNGRKLLDKLNVEGHVAYFPLSGQCVPLDDKFTRNLTIIEEARILADLEKTEGPLNKWANFPVGVRQTRPIPFNVR